MPKPFESVDRETLKPACVPKREALGAAGANFASGRQRTINLTVWGFVYRISLQEFHTATVYGV